MYARVAKWDGADGEALRGTAERINAQAAEGPPEGVPAKRFLLLIDPDNGRSLAIVLFETEEDRAKGDETLGSMTPPDEGMGQRSSVEFYDVAVEVQA